MAISAEYLSDEDIHSCLRSANDSATSMLNDIGVKIYDASFSANITLQANEKETEVEDEKYDVESENAGNEENANTNDDIKTSLDVVNHFFSKSQLHKLPLDTGNYLLKFLGTLETPRLIIENSWKARRKFLNQFLTSEANKKD